MELVIQRDMSDVQCTQGILSIDGMPFCYTMEPRRDQSQGKPYAIPAGRYKVVLYESPHFGFQVPLLVGVPGFEDVEIHIGNKPSDTHGCTLVAKSRIKDFQSGSTETFKQLMAKIATATDPIWAEYKD